LKYFVSGHFLLFLAILIVTAVGGAYINETLYPFMSFDEQEECL